MATLGVLERSGARYAVLHGYENFPEVGGADVDICIDRSVDNRWLRRLLDENAVAIGARVVSARNGSFLLAGETTTGRLFFLKLDFEHHYALGALRFVPGGALLAARRRYGTFHVPSPAHQVAGYLATTVVKGRFDANRTTRLSELYRADPAGALSEIARLWSKRDLPPLTHALADQNWAALAAVAPMLRDNLAERLRRSDPLYALGSATRRIADRLVRAVRPKGLSVVVLGPDGAGKSSICDALSGPALLPIFDRTVCLGFVPPLHRLIGRNDGPSSQPHALAPRSVAGSLIKAAYWLAFSVLSYPSTYAMKVRGGLVLYDRHFVDILVDEKRYRYSGPSWVLRAIWRVIPRPDLIVLLDAPAEVIQERKKELTLAETAGQLAAYRRLVGSLANGIILEANRPLAEVVDALNRLLLARYVRSSANVRRGAPPRQDHTRVEGLLSAANGGAVNESGAAAVQSRVGRVDQRY